MFIEVFAGYLGHSDINTTIDIYAHMTRNIKKMLPSRFNNLFGNILENVNFK